MVSGMIGHHGANPVARLDARFGKGAVGLGHARIELAPGHGRLDLVFTPENQGGAIIVPAQEVFGIVQPGIGEKAASRHLVPIDKDGFSTGFRHNAAELPQF